MQLKDRKIIVTGGPTREWLDPVRFLSNPSTGRMGITLADEASAKGAETVFIHGPINAGLLEGKNYKQIKIDTTRELLDAVLNELEDNAVLIMSAAPADYTPVEKSGIKLKKSGQELVVKFKRTPDILKNVAQCSEEGRFKGLFVVGFAAETSDTEDYAIDKLKKKNLDMICLNDISRKGAGFASDTNIITIFRKNGYKMKLPILSKKKVAERIINEIDSQL